MSLSSSVSISFSDELGFDTIVATIEKLFYLLYLFKTHQITVKILSVNSIKDKHNITWSGYLYF